MDVAQRIKWETTYSRGGRVPYPMIKAVESDNGKHLDLALSGVRYIRQEEPTLEFPFFQVVTTKGNNLLYGIVLDEYISLPRVGSNYYRISDGKVMSDEEMEPLFEENRKRNDDEYERKTKERLERLMTRLQTANEETLKLVFYDLIHGTEGLNARRSATGDVLVEVAFEKIDSGVYSEFEGSEQE